MMSYKGYQIKPHKLFPMSFVVSTEGQGGKIPAVLNGLFTSSGLAQQVIDNYVDNKAIVKERTYASKARTKSGD